MALNFQFAETKTAHPSMNFTPEFTTEFEEAWAFLKKNQGHQATVVFETAEKRDKWFNMAKIYGAQHADKVFVSKVKGTGSDDKGSGKLVFKMETGSDREKRIEENKKRNRMFETLRAHGVDFKRGVGSNVDELHAALMRKTPEERNAMAERTTKAKKAEENKTSAKPQNPAENVKRGTPQNHK